MSLKLDALKYHEHPRPGKIEIQSLKQCDTAYDLSLAYSPGVAEPVREIQKNPEDAYRYTNKGNLVAVISNGTAVLGLGDTGALASKPVMEGKGILFKKFAGIDVYDIEVNETDPDLFIQTVVAIAPTFGGINLEDIKAPECFYIESELKKRLDIPVFHDDQHGTAVIVAAGLQNALEIVDKKINEIKVVFLGAGAAGLSCAKLIKHLGVTEIHLVDRKGVLNQSRTDCNEYNKEFISDTAHNSLEEIIDGADVFIGLSGANLFPKEYLLKMKRDPIIFALANPDPEITPEEALSIRDDVIMATGRSDYANQVNNVLGFPFLFRGALDARAPQISQKMMLAASQGLAKLTKEPVPQSVLEAYKINELKFGRDYIIPKPFDPRLNQFVAESVRLAALEEFKK
ncbi:MAG: malic enzyme-like NAD(P)-binding protein [Methylophilaceae bacterium]|jgi:malate dehydrogenase (oxaloacetate-decarboxylating)(NADP+)